MHAALLSFRHFTFFATYQMDSLQGGIFHLLLCLCCFRLQPRTEAVLGPLVSKRVDCRDALLSVWKTEDKCKCDLMCLVSLLWVWFDRPSCHLIMLFSHVFFSYSSVVRILSVASWIHASRSSQKLASYIKACIWKAEIILWTFDQRLTLTCRWPEPPSSL